MFTASLVKFLNPFLRWSNLLLVLVTLLAYVSPYFNPAQVWQFSFLGLGYPLLLLANLLFAGWWLFRRDRYFFFSAGCLLVGIGYLTSFWSWHFFKSSPPAEHEINILTFNTGGFHDYSKKQNYSPEIIAAGLSKISKKYGTPDIVCAQEATQDRVSDAIQKAFDVPHFVRQKGVALFSKYPILKNDALPFGKTGNGCIWADLQTPKGIIRVYSLHLQSNRLSWTANRIATEGNFREKQTWKDVRFVLSRYKQAVQIRAKQAQMLAEHTARCPHPVLICGDFNDTPVSYVYRLLAKGRKDSFREKGAGVGSTFAGRLPALRIDYVLANPRFRVLDHRVPDVKLSDHFPVFARLSW